MDTQRNFSVQRLATAVEQVPSSTMELLLSMYNVNRDKLNSSLLQTKNEQQRLSSASPSSIAAAVAAVSALSSASPSLAPDPPGFIGPFQISSLLANGTFPASSSILGVNASHGSSQPPSFDPWSYPFVVTSPPLGQTTDSGPVLRGLISSEGNQGMSVGASASASASHTGLGCDQDSSQDKKGHPGKEDSISCVVAKKKKKKKWTRPGRTGSFPQKLHKMLRDLEENGKQDVASFDQDGLAFQIHQPNRFAQEVLPTYFPKMAKYSSFQRQLNLYNFEYDRKGTHRSTYRHELFQKDKPLLSLSMKRTKIKGAPQS